ncbi:MAG: DbpA RNA binding domain-containing protein [Lachnospiraceae bacterium]|nr:DbpA RNA binding domain-containing protein [Lachnospiraceae bacterium]
MIDEQLLNRYRELADRSAYSGIYVYTDFHSLSGASYAYTVADKAFIKLWGGAEEAERVIVRFGDPKDIGYEEDFPIRIIHISPIQPKFADKLTHRDFLGALMNLGIERDVIGDIYVAESEAYVFVCEKIAGYIIEELTRVKHTQVKCVITGTIPESVRPKLKEETVTVSSLRLDGIIAHVYHMSRTAAKSLFSSEEVFINGALCTSPSAEAKDTDVISVRGYGKFIYDGVGRKTSKDRYAVNIRRYI